MHKTDDSHFKTQLKHLVQRNDTISSPAAVDTHLALNFQQTLQCICHLATRTGRPAGRRRNNWRARIDPMIWRLWQNPRWRRFTELSSCVTRRRRRPVWLAKSSSWWTSLWRFTDHIGHTCGFNRGARSGSTCALGACATDHTTWILLLNAR